MSTDERDLDIIRDLQIKAAQVDSYVLNLLKGILFVLHILFKMYTILNQTK